MASKPVQCGFESHPGHSNRDVCLASRRPSHARICRITTLPSESHVPRQFTVTVLSVDRMSVALVHTAAMYSAAVQRAALVPTGAIQPVARSHGDRSRPADRARVARPTPEKEQASTANCPRCDGVPLDEPAYAYLLGLYLGDGCINAANRERAYTRCPSSAADAWPGLIRRRSAPCEAVRPCSKVFYVAAEAGMTEVQELLEALAVPVSAARAGHEAHQEDRAQPVAAGHRGPLSRRLRPGAVPLGRLPGHEPGAAGAGRRRHWYEYPRYLFSNKSKDILGLCGAALDRLGVEWRFARPDMISVAKKEAVARLDEFVGPKY